MLIAKINQVKKQNEFFEEKLINPAIIFIVGMGIGFWFSIVILIVAKLLKII